MFASGVQRVVDNFDGMHAPGSFNSVEQAFAALATGDSAGRDPARRAVAGDGRHHRAGHPQTAGAAVPGSIILTVFDDADKIFRAVCAGASGYILKSSGIDQIGEVIRQVMDGGAPMTPEVARKVLNAFAAIEPGRRRQ
jgi:hypothetical protein